MPIKIDMDKSPKAQLEALRNRQKLITTSKWNELEKEAHDKAFTVAKVMSADVLQDIYDYIQSAVKEGWSYDTFKKKVRDGGLVERMQNAGWLKTATDKQIGARLQVIIDTNVKMAYGKGNYNRLMLVKDKKPYWIYHQVERKTKRAEHSIYNGRKFHCDDPIWNTIYPPSGFRCSCWVEAVAEPDGVESGSNIEINPDEHPISPLSVWKPETTKYVEGIGKALEGTLRMKNDEDFKERIQKLMESDDKWDAWDNLDCDLISKPSFSSINDAILFSRNYNAENNDCDEPVPGQLTWQDYNLKLPKTILKGIKGNIVDILPAIDAPAEAIASITNIITKGTNQPYTIDNGFQKITLSENVAIHMIVNKEGKRRDDGRERYAELVIPTITEPDEIWKTMFLSKKTGEKYYKISYIKYCVLENNKLMFASASYNKEVNDFLFTFYAREKDNMHQRRQGELIRVSPFVKNNSNK